MLHGTSKNANAAATIANSSKYLRRKPVSLAIFAFRLTRNRASNGHPARGAGSAFSVPAPKPRRQRSVLPRGTISLAQFSMMDTAGNL
jgi:hypothetical protein